MGWFNLHGVWFRVKEGSASDLDPRYLRQALNDLAMLKAIAPDLEVRHFTRPGMWHITSTFGRDEIHVNIEQVPIPEEPRVEKEEELIYRDWTVAFDVQIDTTLVGLAICEPGKGLRPPFRYVEYENAFTNSKSTSNAEDGERGLIAIDYREQIYKYFDIDPVLDSYASIDKDSQFRKWLCGECVRVTIPLIMGDLWCGEKTTVYTPKMNGLSFAGSKSSASESNHVCVSAGSVPSNSSFGQTLSSNGESWSSIYGGFGSQKGFGGGLVLSAVIDGHYEHPSWIDNGYVDGVYAFTSSGVVKLPVAVPWYPSKPAFSYDYPSPLATVYSIDKMGDKRILAGVVCDYWSSGPRIATVVGNLDTGEYLVWEGTKTGDLSRYINALNVSDTDWIGKYPLDGEINSQSFRVLRIEGWPYAK